MRRESRAIPKACGIETEFGILVPEHLHLDDAVNIFVRYSKQEWICKKFLSNVGWDPKVRLTAQERTHDEEDLRAHPMFKDAEWMFKSNRIWDNGARFYRDGMHPEVSTPTCLDPKNLIIWNRACYRNIETIRRKFAEECALKFELFRNNVALAAERFDRYGKDTEKQPWSPRTTFACHTNITVKRSIDKAELILKDIPFFIFLTPVVGAGKIGGDNGTAWADFQISQRADWCEDLSSPTTTVCRPIHNTRDNPYATWDKFRRVHIICFDSNMLELPDYLKVGLTSILYMMLEDKEMDNRFWPSENPVRLFQAISRDIDLGLKVNTFGHRTARQVTDLLKEYADLFWSYLECYHPRNEILKDVVIRFQDVIDLLATKKWEDLRGKLDWVLKKFFVRRKLAQAGASWQSALAYSLDVEYHNNSEDGIFRKLERSPAVNAVRISTDSEIESARFQPPPTRSKWIVEILDRYKEWVLTSDYWYHIKFCWRKDREFVDLYIGDPTIRWDEFLAGDILNLPFDKFVQAAENLPFMSVEIGEAHPRDNDERLTDPRIRLRLE